MEEIVFIVDFDLKTDNPSRRVAFYNRVHRLFRRNIGKDMQFSSSSCWVTKDMRLALDVFDLCKDYARKVNLWRAVKLQ